MKKLSKYILFLVVLGLSACNPLQLEEVVDPNNPSLASVGTMPRGSKYSS
jgi:hypothetical protein